MVSLDGTYWTLTGGGWRRLALREIVDLDLGQVWSGRLSTGLFGLHECRAGNRGPKSATEVIVAPGDAGLEWLIRGRFRPCPVCKPHETDGFRDKTHILIRHKYGSFRQFTDPTSVPYSAAPLPWEEILPVTGATPNRLYLSPDLSARDITRLRNRFARLGHDLPPVGYYDKDAPGRFREYGL